MMILELVRLCMPLFGLQNDHGIETYRRSGRPDTSFHEYAHTDKDREFLAREDTVVCQQVMWNEFL
jgi:hypothetical protein